MTITLEAIRAAGGIVHSDGNIFFRDISMLQGLAGAGPAAVAPQGEYPHLPQSVGDVTDFGDGKTDIDWGHPAPVGGTRLYSADQMRAYVDADRVARAGLPAAVAGPADEREAFEDWARNKTDWKPNLERRGDGYAGGFAQTAWEAWRGRGAAPALEAPAAPEAAPWCPDVCPITGRPFFMWIEHWQTGKPVPTYGGPYDSYTIPVKDSDGSFECERYDHDEGGWLTEGAGWHCLGVKLVDDQSFVVAPANPRYSEIEAFAAAAPQAPAAPVAYLDLGAGGYMDLGTDLSEQQLGALPKGRHMLAIIGTHGIDGYAAAPAAPVTPAAAMAALKAAFAADPEYAWSWHCAAWSCAHDEGLATDAANRAAARLMYMAFDCDTSKHPNFLDEHRRAAPAAPAVDADPLGLRDVGEALMETIDRNADALKAVGWLGPMDCPSEIVVDLINLLDEANTTSALGEWVATLEVDSEGGLDYETVPPCTLPAGCYPLYRAAQAKEGGA
ncbi:hypothetical protein [Delftia acidovorans]|uniref:hypothetical protein n=1 Tax=Delftia acidovorans TaxID=80866 RepID=UPI001D0C097B|nr:hypothetical protein [Delftia acidovorans]